MSTGNLSSPELESKTNGKGYAFGAVVLVYEVMVCIVYGLLFDYNLSLDTFMANDILLICGLIIFSVLGFGILNAYITNASFMGMALNTLIFVLTIQHYFLFRAFWFKAGVSSISSAATFGEEGRYAEITFSNFGNDRQVVSVLGVAPLSEAIACAVGLMVAYSSVVGRVALIQVFFLTLWGTFFYDVNSQLFWRLFITDTGYGMRTFLFGSVTGLISAFILGGKQETLDHSRYISIYASRAFGFFGLCIMFCTFPFLCLSDLYRTSSNDAPILAAAPLNMWLSLAAGINGAFCISALVYRRIHPHDIIFSGLCGGIAYSSLCDIHISPAIPLAVGSVVGAISCFFHNRSVRNINKDGVVTSLSMINRFLIPSFIGSCLSAILQGVNESGIPGVYLQNSNPDRGAAANGGFQILGLLLTIGFGLITSILVGFSYRLFNNHDRSQQFNDNNVFQVEMKTTQKQNGPSS